MQELRTIILSGKLGKRFGKYHKLAVSSPAEAIRALCLTIKGFQEELSTSHFNNIEYAIFVGKNNLHKDDLTLRSDNKDIKIVPLIRGSKQGVLQTIIGVVLIVVGVVFSQPWAVQLGAAMTLGGVVQMLTPQTATQTGSNADNGTSYNFNGPVNTSAQGVPVPLLYGTLLVGGAVISGGIQAEDQA